MDKVIDGVNVSRCKFYEPKAQVMTCHEESITKRCDGTRCYYKQLKRLEQENETLERTNNELRKRFSEDTTKLSAEVQELKVECERLSWLLETKCQDELEKENAELKAECEKKDNIITDITKGAVKYRKALEDIRDIEETCLNFYKCEKCKFYKECQCDLEEYILAKINEVIGAEE